MAGAMRIPVLDESVAQIAYIEPVVEAGVITYQIVFECAHERATIEFNEEPFAHRSVYCTDCQNRELSEAQAEELLG